MDTNNLDEKPGRGRPRVKDRKVKLDNIRLKTSTTLDIVVIAEHLDITQSLFLQTILDNEMPKYKKLFNLDEI